MEEVREHVESFALKIIKLYYQINVITLPKWKRLKLVWVCLAEKVIIRAQTSKNLYKKYCKNRFNNSFFLDEVMPVESGKATTLVDEEEEDCEDEDEFVTVESSFETDVSY